MNCPLPGGANLESRPNLAIRQLSSPRCHEILEWLPGFWIQKMLLHIRQILPPERVAEMRRLLEEGSWEDGRQTAGYLSARVKDNAQLPEASPVARQLSGMVLDALEQSAQFRAAALPIRIVPPLFNRYSGGQAYGGHIDGALRNIPGTRFAARTDLAATLF